MTVSIWWLLLVFAVGAYVGIMLLATLIVSSDQPQTDALQLGDDPVLARIAAQWRSGEKIRSNHRRTSRKRSETPVDAQDPLEKQADLQW